MNVRCVVIVGAGPAGLTAALELVRAGVQPIVVEAESQVGGISKTINFEGNRMDLGGHRFFSKSDWVMKWWQEILPIDREQSAAQSVRLAYQGQERKLAVHHAAESGDKDRVMLIRPRLSRIYYLRRFFDYPVKLNFNTISNLGPLRMAQIGLSYGAARIAPIRNEQTLEEFLVNRFGRELYCTFFKDYTEKVWGVPCREISAEWGAQRIKGLSITKALLHAARQALAGARAQGGGDNKGVETSLIEQFMYPKLGPGQLWEVVAEKVQRGGGQVHLNQRVSKIHRDGFRITGVDILDSTTNACRFQPCTELISTMPIKTLMEAMTPTVADAPLAIASALPYRDFITAGLLVPRMLPVRGTNVQSQNGMPPDNWIYVQEPDVKLGRLQIFNNWSPAMVKDHPKIFLGLEYFAAEGDALWNMPRDQFLSFAAKELAQIGLISAEEVEAGTVVKVPKAYPAYFGSYAQMPKVRDFLSQFTNLYPIGRNGMHRYNNQDHSMVSAKIAVECVLDPSQRREAIWEVNVEQDYHEEK